MDTTELIEQVRASAFIDANHPVYTTARILKELWNQQNVLFSPILAKARQGYGLRWSLESTVANVPFVRIPPRAIVNSLERADLSVDGTTFGKLGEATPREWPAYETITGIPSRYMKRGDKLFLGPVPGGVYTARLWYYLRPSKLYTAQALGEVTELGAAEEPPNFWVDGLPVKYASVGDVLGTTLTTGDICDVVSSDGLFDVLASDLEIDSLFGAGPTQVSFVGDPDLSQVTANTGCMLRAAQQTEWPALPVDFHGTLADAAAVLVLLGLGKRDKAAALAEKVQGDLGRFQELLTPRVKEDTYAARPAMQVLRRGRAGSMPWGGP